MLVSLDQYKCLCTAAVHRSHRACCPCFNAHTRYVPAHGPPQHDGPPHHASLPGSPHLMAARSGKLTHGLVPQQCCPSRAHSDAIRAEDSSQEHARAVAELWPRVLAAQIHQWSWCALAGDFALDQGRRLQNLTSMSMHSFLVVLCHDRVLPPDLGFGASSNPVCGLALRPDAILACRHGDRTLAPLPKRRC